MDSSHRVNIIKISEILPHKNADKLEIVQCGGFQVVVRKNDFKLGDLAVYLQPDAVVPEHDEVFKFIYEKDGGGQLRVFAPEMPIPERYRRVTVRKFRGEWSEGILLPISDFGFKPVDAPDFNNQSYILTTCAAAACMHMNFSVYEGLDVAGILGITHYNPPEPDEIEIRGSSVKQSKIWPRSAKGWFYFLGYWLTFGLYNPWGELGGGNEKAPENTPPVYDVETLKNYKDAFVDGEKVVVTEKIHGANARYTYREPTFGGKMYCGSRKLWKGKNSKNIWRSVMENTPDIERWCKDHPGYTLYGEVVPCQKSKRGGFEYSYGATKEFPEFYLFDIMDPNGEWVPFDEAENLINTSDDPEFPEYDIMSVPLLYAGDYNYPMFLQMAEGKTQTDGEHIREGVVIKATPDRNVRGLGRLQLKIVGNGYYEAEKE